MKCSESWLREWVNPNIDTAELVEQLTMAGLEVDGVEPAAGHFSGVVVSEIISVEQHPDAEKLRICIVAGHKDGDKQVVCGAANARAGIKIPFATIGAVLPGDFKIKKAKLRGVESFGMLCGQTELQAGDDDSGLWELPDDAPTGTDLREYLKLDDHILDIDLTPNRGDCLSMRGLAREVGVLNGEAVREPEDSAVGESIDDTFDVQLEAAEACPAYVGRVIKNIDLNATTPLWMIEKLRRSGLRSIDPVVDVTNFVLLELGQPMHAFDLDTLDRAISVRMASKGEKLELLNDQVIELNPDSLVIADKSGPIALAGIMGGNRTAVSSKTENIFLESAYFNPIAIAGKARLYGLHTDSSHRFERGVDHTLQSRAIHRATELLLSIVGGEVGPLIVVDAASSKPEVRQIQLRRSRIEQGLGLKPSDIDVGDIMKRLGLNIINEDHDGWVLQVPSYRFDLSIEEDLLEEIARIYGYDRLPTRKLTLAPDLESHSETLTTSERVKHALVDLGFQEVITYSFIDPKTHSEFFPNIRAIELKNPISAELSSMRTSLIPGLVQTAQYNFKRQQARARFFEAGMTFCPDGADLGKAKQRQNLAGLCGGALSETSWAQAARDFDFYDLKGDVEQLLSIVAPGNNCVFSALNISPTTEQLLHPGQAAEIHLGDQFAGYIGALHPVLLKRLGINKTIFVFELDLALIKHAKLPGFVPLSKQPEVSRDLAIVVDKGLCVADIDNSIRKTAGSVLKQLKLFDVYSGEGIDSEKKSLAFSLTFQHASQTLVDDEITILMGSIVEQLEKDFNASLR